MNMLKMVDDRNSKKRSFINRKSEEDMIANRPIYEKGPDPGYLERLQYVPDKEQIDSMTSKVKKPFWKNAWNRVVQLGLKKSEYSRLLLDLDQHYCSLFVMFHQYEKHFFYLKSSNILKNEAEKLRDCIHSVQRSIHRVGNRMASMGVLPTSTLKKQSKLSYIRHEPDGMPEKHDMLARDFGHENVIFEKIVKTSEQSLKLDDTETSELIFTLAEDVQRRLSILSDMFKPRSIQQKEFRPNLDLDVKGSQVIELRKKDRSSILLN